MMLTMVTLNLFVSLAAVLPNSASLKRPRERRNQNLQSSNAEHQGDADLLLPVKVQLAQLREGNAQHEDIQGDAHGSVGPGHGADVDTLAAALAAPVGPVVADGAALKQRRDDEGHAKDDIEGHGTENDTSDALAGKDTLRNEISKFCSSFQALVQYIYIANTTHSGESNHTR